MSFTLGCSVSIEHALECYDATLNVRSCLAACKTAKHRSIWVASTAGGFCSSS